MAKITSMLQIEGTIGGITFYKTKNGYFAKRKTSISRTRLMKDPAYAGTRVNMALFTRAAHAAKLFRTAFRPLLQRAADNRITARLMGSMRSAINSDTTHERGEGTVQNGNPQLLEGFECNDNAHLANTLLAPITASIARKSGVMVVDIPAFDPAMAMRVPAAATHFRLFSGGAAIDFERRTYHNATSESEYLSVNVEQTEPIQLVVEIKPRSTGVFFLLLGIEFFQIVNEVPIAIRNSGANALAVMRVACATK